MFSRDGRRSIRAKRPRPRPYVTIRADPRKRVRAPSQFSQSRLSLGARFPLRKAVTFFTVEARGCRPLRRSKTKRESPSTSRPNRVGGVLVARRYFSTRCSSMSSSTRRSPMIVS
jgi:hypothetical protein